MEAAEMGDVEVVLTIRESDRVAVVREVIERFGGQPAGEGARGAGQPDASGSRLVKEIRLRGMGGMAAGNACPPEFMTDFNCACSARAVPRRPTGRGYF